MTVDAHLQQGKQRFARWIKICRQHRGLHRLGYGAAGFVLSAAGLAGMPQPFAAALAISVTGWRGAAAALGSIAGYLLFWGNSGAMGLVWTGASWLIALTLGRTRLVRQTRLLLPAFSACAASVTGLIFQLRGQDIPTLAYLLQVGIAWAAAQLFCALGRRREPGLIWCTQGIFILALGRIAPLAWLNLGVIGAGLLGVWEAFPGALLAGVALDLIRVGPVPMTALLALVCLVRMIPGIPGWLLRLVPGLACFFTGALLGVEVFVQLPGLVLGGLLSALLPRRTAPAHRRGETGVVQVRLELMAQVMLHFRLLLLETEDTAIDEVSLLARTRERACGGCPNRRACHSPDPLPGSLLHSPVTENTSLPFFCRKPGRMAVELRRTQEQYRLLKADRQRQREYRSAVGQQYLFLSEYLQGQSEQLARRGKRFRGIFAPEVGCAAKSREPENGDRFTHFSGPGGQYFLLLCDGMGTGPGAAEEGHRATSLLRRMLTAGFPAEHALESLNSLLALTGRAGAVTVDLARVQLDTGTAVLYKWGAVPSCLLRAGAAEKIGTAGPPPGIHGWDIREHQERLSLRRGEWLIMHSDGVDGEELRCRAVTMKAASAGEMAERLLEAGAEEMLDDATVAVVRLRRERMLT